MLRRSPLRPQSGVMLLEVLVTLLVLAVGLLGLAGLQAKTQAVEAESYQRGQALVLQEDMVSRLAAGAAASANAAPYLTTAAGTQGVLNCAPLSGPAFDLCQWNNDLAGVAEVHAGNRVGAMLGARGCIFQVQAPDNTAGVCKPGIYQVDIAWQGMHKTNSPPSNCGTDAQYGGPGYRRVVSRTVTLGVHGCESI